MGSKMKKLHIFADNLFAHEILHFLSGVGMFFLMYRLFGKFSLGWVAFFTSMLIDVDHYFEGLLYNRFRINLYGLESANKKTLDRLNKNLKVKQIEKSLSMAKKSGLWPHVTVMVGYPWEGRAGNHRYH